MARVTLPDHLFAGGFISDALRAQEKKLADAAEAIPPDRALARTPEELAAELVETFQVEPLELSWDSMTARSEDARVDVSGDPRRFIMSEGPFYVAGTRVTYHVPFSGERDLFKFRPSTHTLNPPRGIVRDNELLLVATAPADSREGIKPGLDREVENVKLYVGYINADVAKFNEHLPTVARQAAQQRRDKVVGDRELEASLGVPVRRRADDVPGYAVAPKQRRAIPPRSEGRAARAAEPFLSPEVYEDILRAVRNMALVLERSPKAFAQMGEEDLRHQFLVPLNAQFEGAASGETFNFEGKTDILLRHEGRNLFIAECKVWDGPKTLTNAVDQILGYASWRDTKTAVVLFNRRRDLSKVLAQVSPTVQAHGNFVREIAYGGETEFRFVLHHRDDAERELTLTVLVFEVPSPGSDETS
jgi:hypothetical protein